MGQVDYVSISKTVETLWQQTNASALGCRETGIPQLYYESRTATSSSNITQTIAEIDGSDLLCLVGSGDSVSASANEYGESEDPNLCTETDLEECVCTNSAEFLSAPRRSSTSSDRFGWCMTFSV